MIRGTTPTHRFTLPIDTGLLRCVRIIYAQNDEVIFIKDTGDCTLEENTIAVTLTQEETFMIDCHKYLQIQIRALTLNDEALASQVLRVEVEKCLDSEVIV